MHRFSLSRMGFNVALILGSLGLVGMAVALGAQVLIKNMFAGLTIFLDRIFEKGNWIKSPRFLAVAVPIDRLGAGRTFGIKNQERKSG